MPSTKQTRLKLLAAAELILIEQGITGVSVRKVGEAAGVNPTLVNYHFAGLSSLLDAVCEGNLAAITSGWTRVEPLADPPQDLDTVLRAWIEPMRKPAVYTGKGRTLDVLDEIVAHGDAQLRHQLLATLRDFIDALYTALAPHCPKLEEEELRVRLRLIAGAVLGPPPRGSILAGYKGSLPLDDMSYLLRFARAALET